MDLDDQKEIAAQFGADAEPEVVESFDDSEKPGDQEIGDKGKAATDALLSEDGPEKDD